ncbi:hypothetical protein B0H11DRAFT_2399940 [Mycena galericulata]|nr:hypothetical protein B0H11DRAFT_2399940 [Mycena galericulata]
MPHKRAKRSIREEQRSQKGADLAPRSGGGGGDPLSNEPLPKSFLRALNAEQVRADFRAKRKRQRDDGDSNREYEGGGKEKRRKLGGEGEGKNGNGKAEGKNGNRETKIRPGETLAHFNKRIESDMRPLVRSAVQASLATTRAERKKALSSTASAASTSTPTPSASSSANAKSKPHQKHTDADDASQMQMPEDKHAHRPKEFARTSSAAPRRLNDIALAPPDLSAMARRANAKNTNTTNTMNGAGAAGKGKDGKKAPSTKASSILSPAQALQMAAAREDAVRRYREMKAARWAAGGGGDGERGGGAVGEGEGEGE